MKLAPGHKMQFFQLPQTQTGYTAIDDDIWTPFMPEGVTYRDDVYKVAGGYVGTAHATRRELDPGVLTLERNPWLVGVQGVLQHAADEDEQGDILPRSHLAPREPPRL